MATSTFRLSNSREIFNTGASVDTNNGPLGDIATITTAADFSIVPTTTFSRYYYIYVIKTDATINVTIPLSIQVTRGWRARFILVSAAKTGLVNLFDGATTIALLNASNENIYSGVEIHLVNSANSLWRVTTYLTTSTSQRLVTYDLVSGFSIPGPIPVVKSYSYGRFFSFSGIGGSAVIDGNTITPIAIPWDTNTPGRYIDSAYFNPLSTTQIRTPNNSYIRLTACIYVNTAGGATPVRFARLYVNGGAGTLPTENNLGTISTSATQVIYMTFINPNLNSATFLELKIGKLVASIGTNIVDRTLSYVSVEYLTI